MPDSLLFTLINPQNAIDKHHQKFFSQYLDDGNWIVLLKQIQKTYLEIISVLKKSNYKSTAAEVIKPLSIQLESQLKEIDIDQFIVFCTKCPELKENYIKSLIDNMPKEYKSRNSFTLKEDRRGAKFLAEMYLTLLNYELMNMKFLIKTCEVFIKHFKLYSFKHIDDFSQDNDQIELFSKLDRQVTSQVELSFRDYYSLRDTKKKSERISLTKKYQPPLYEVLNITYRDIKPDELAVLIDMLKAEDFSEPKVTTTVVRDIFARTYTGLIDILELAYKEYIPEEKTLSGPKKITCE